MAWHERTVEALARGSVPSPDEYLRHLRSEPVRTVMTSPPISVMESALLPSALALLRDRGVHRLPVTRDGRLVGILTGSDVLLAMLAQIDTMHETHRRDELQPPAQLLASVGGD